MATQNVTLPISGMTCANCAMNIERAVKKLDGVAEARVNFAAEQAAISFDPARLQIKDVIATIQGAGFSVPTNKTEIAQTGSCSAILQTLNTVMDR